MFTYKRVGQRGQFQIRVDGMVGRRGGGGGGREECDNEGGQWTAWSICKRRAVDAAATEQAVTFWLY